MRAYLSPAEVAELRPALSPPEQPHSRCAALRNARRDMVRLGLDGPNQQMGRRWPVVCVAVEITQRCNLDCTLCYLSERSEAVHDLPLREVLRRLDLVRAHYGPGTDVQITGGDPTLREHRELVEIVRHAARLELRPTLMTNGLRASAKLLRALAAAGLQDVAFHVDSTQRRHGYASEGALNRLRERYLRAAAGTGLSVMFNTTVHAGNFDDIPMLVRFFVAHAAEIRTVGFQLQADTGRGVWRARAPHITLASVQAQVEAGAGSGLNFEASRIGHPGCSRYALGLVIAGRLHDILTDSAVVARLQHLSEDLPLFRNDPRRMALAFLRWLGLDGRRWLGAATGLRYAFRFAWRARSELWRSRGRAYPLSVALHSFMDSGRLERDRLDGCIFKVMTADGPIAMCAHNAKRDEFILRPLPVQDGRATSYWDPVTGRTGADPDPAAVPLDVLPAKRRKGRARRGPAEAELR